MENCKIFYKFRNGDCLVVPEDGFLVNGKCIDMCREDEIKIDYNPYHDKQGRFTSKSGVGTRNAKHVELVEMIKKRTVPLFGMPKLANELGLTSEEYKELKRKHYPKKESVVKPNKKKPELDPDMEAKVKAAHKEIQLRNKRLVDKVSKECWVDTEKASAYVYALKDWAETAYEGIRSVQSGRKRSYDGVEYSEGQLKKFVHQSEILEDFIARAPKYKGAAYRGINLDVQPFKKGQTIDMAGTSSWSTDEVIAKTFANSRIDREHCVIFRTKELKKGVEIDHLLEYGEKEVLVSQTSKFKVVDVKSEKTSVGVVSRTMTFVDLVEV